MSIRTVSGLILTGVWLGLSQVGLGFHLLYGQGATVLFYFLLLNVWLTGSIVGLILRDRIASHSLLLQILCLITFALAAVLTRFETFSIVSSVSVYLCAALTGMFGGWFLSWQVKTIGQVSQVLFHENNGFIAGYAIAGCLLFVSITGLDALVAVFAVLSMLVSSPLPATTGLPEVEKAGGRM